MNTKYEIIKEDFLDIDDHLRVYRIKAITNFSFIQAGDIGGYIEKEGNLSVYGDAWVYGNASVYGDARVSGDNILHFIGLQYPITATAKNIVIGCNIKNHLEWIQTDKEEAESMGLKSENYDFYYSMIVIMTKKLFGLDNKTTNKQLIAFLKKEYLKQQEVSNNV